MSAIIPKISVTVEQNQVQTPPSEDEDCLSNDMEYNLYSGNNTDVEDFDSQISNNKPFTSSNKNLFDTLNLAKRLDIDNDVTDEEDFNLEFDNSEDQKSYIYPELKISLQEFLQYGEHERIITNNETHGKVEIKAGNFLLAQNLNGINDYLTDCEDYNTDSEVEDCYEKSACVDLENTLGDPGNICITDEPKFKTKDIKHTHDDDFNEEDDDCENMSYVSDISDLASALSDVGEGFNLSEDELLEVSGKEEICQICYSGSSSDAENSDLSPKGGSCGLPSIDVTFVASKTNINKPCASSNSMQNLLQTQKYKEEVLTDIEPIFDSAAEEESFDNDENDDPIPQAIILTSGNDDACQTDIEEMPGEETLLNHEEESVPEQLIPTPHREVIELKENKFGDTITNVMPMDNDFRFGIYNNFKDDLPTDSEDFSAADDVKVKSEECMDEHLIFSPNLIESDVIISNEILKPCVKKRIELHTSNESVTDVEEIYLAGTNRRKKLKAHSMSKAKSKFLEVERPNEASGTDIEDFELSESGMVIKNCPNDDIQNETNENPNEANVMTYNEMITDVEDISAEDNYDALGACLPEITNSNLIDYLENSANIVITKEIDPNQEISASLLKPNQQNFPLNLTFTEDKNLHQALTDDEEVQLPSDGDDLSFDNKNYNTTCENPEIIELLNETYTVVHEKSGNNFNVEIEKLNIKGMPENRDAITDTEYFELDESEKR